ncbi:hypothetical protein OG21DRAFT_222698 [Imleria badia]|nr:hypothetical protein OG21DRAFT_222698 [Imleria badia]
MSDSLRSIFCSYTTILCYISYSRLCNSPLPLRVTTTVTGHCHREKLYLPNFHPQVLVTLACVITTPFCSLRTPEAA